jgi:hypothetical protein
MPAGGSLAGCQGVLWDPLSRQPLASNLQVLGAHQRAEDGIAHARPRQGAVAHSERGQHAEFPPVHRVPGPAARLLGEGKL